MNNDKLYGYNKWNTFLKYLVGRNIIRVAYFIFNIFFI